MTDTVTLSIEVRVDGLLVGQDTTPIQLTPGNRWSFYLRPVNKLHSHDFLQAELHLLDASEFPDWLSVRWALLLNATTFGPRPGLLYRKPTDVPCDVVHFSPTWEATPEDARRLAHMWPEARELRELLDTGVWTLSYRVVAA